MNKLDQAGFPSILVKMSFCENVDLLSFNPSTGVLNPKSPLPGMMKLNTAALRQSIRVARVGLAVQQTGAGRQKRGSAYRIRLIRASGMYASVLGED